MLLYSVCQLFLKSNCTFKQVEERKDSKFNGLFFINKKVSQEVCLVFRWSYCFTGFLKSFKVALPFSKIWFHHCFRQQSLFNIKLIFSSVQYMYQYITNNNDVISWLHVNHFKTWVQPRHVVHCLPYFLFV